MNEAEPTADSHAWARRDRLGFLAAFLRTTSEIITEPTSFFQKVSPSTPFQGSLVYGVLIFVVSMLFSALWQIALQLVGMGGTSEALSGAASIGLMLGIVVLSPVLAVIFLFLVAGVLHLVVLAFGWSEAPFGATVKVVCFAGVAGLANAIPMCGGIVSSIWGLVLTVIGIREVHGTSTGQAVVVALTPTVLILLCAVCIVAMAVGIAAGSVV